MRLLLIRHGQSLANIEGRIQDGSDPLTPEGRNQAAALARALMLRGDITHLYASPLDRARETAEIVGSTIGIAPQLEPGLAEIDTGIAAGQLWTVWKAANPDLATAMEPDRGRIESWPGGESGTEHRARVLAAFDRINERHAGTNDVIAIVSHGGSLAWIAAMLYGDPLDRWPHQRATLANCSISEVVADASGTLLVTSWNGTAHLITQ